MNRLSMWKRLALVQVLVFVITFGAVRTARAQSIVYGDNLPAGQVLEGDVILMGNTVNLDGDVVGDALVIGNRVNINGTVEGSLAVVGETVIINGEVKGTTYASAVTLELGEASNLQRNLYFAGLDMIMRPGSQIGRDLYAFSLLGAELSGSVGGNIKAIIGPNAIVKLLIEWVKNQAALRQGGYLLTPPSSWAGFDKPVRGKLLGSLSTIGMYDLRSIVSEKEGLARSSSVMEVSAAPLQGGTTGIDTVRLGQWALERLKDFVVLLIYGFIGLWLFTPFLNQARDALRTKPLPSTGYGFLAFIIAINIFGIAAILATLIFVLGLGLGFIGLWELTWAVWAVGFSALGLATALFALFVLYGATIIVAYWAGNMIFRLFGEKASGYRMLSLVLGLLIYVLLRSIPLVGWVISVVVTALGLGAAVVAYIERRRLARSLPESQAV